MQALQGMRNIDPGTRRGLVAINKERYKNTQMCISKSHQMNRANLYTILKVVSDDD